MSLCGLYSGVSGSYVHVLGSTFHFLSQRENLKRFGLIGSMTDPSG